MELNRNIEQTPETTTKADYHKPRLVEYGSLQEYTLGFVPGGIEDAGGTRMFRAGAS